MVALDLNDPCYLEGISCMFLELTILYFQQKILILATRQKTDIVKTNASFGPLHWINVFLVATVYSTAFSNQHQMFVYCSLSHTKGHGEKSTFLARRAIMCLAYVNLIREIKKMLIKASLDQQYSCVGVWCKEVQFTTTTRTTRSLGLAATANSGRPLNLSTKI